MFPRIDAETNALDVLSSLVDKPWLALVAMLLLFVLACLWLLERAKQHRAQERLAEKAAKAARKGRITPPPYTGPLVLALLLSGCAKPELALEPQPKFALTLTGRIGIAGARGHHVTATVRQVSGPPTCAAISWELLGTADEINWQTLDRGAHAPDCEPGMGWDRVEMRDWWLGVGLYQVVAVVQWATRRQRLTALSEVR